MDAAWFCFRYQNPVSGEMALPIPQRARPKSNESLTESGFSLRVAIPPSASRPNAFGAPSLALSPEPPVPGPKHSALGSVLIETAPVY